MNKTIVTILILIGVAGLLFYVTRENSATPPANQAADQSAVNGKSLEAKINEEGSVKVKITPMDVSPVSSTWKFNIVLDTHSVELDYDLIKTVSLFDERGKEYKPVSWEGAGPGGHHRDGSLIFNAVTPPPKEIEIRVLNVGEVAIRSFVWQLQ